MIHAEVGRPHIEVYKTWVHESWRTGDDPPLSVGIRVVVEAGDGRMWPGTVSAYEHFVWEISLDRQ